MTDEEILPVDDERKRLLLSATGTVGSTVEDFLLERIHEDKGNFFVAAESGFLGIAAASYFYVIRYDKNRDIEALAMFLFSAYREFYYERNATFLSLGDAQSIDEYYRIEGSVGVTEYTKTLVARDPAIALDELTTLFASRLQSKSGFLVDERQLRGKLELSFSALMVTLRHFLDKPRIP